MDHNTGGSCFYLLFLTLAVGCSTKSRTSDSSKARDDSPTAGQSEERKDTVAKTGRSESTKQKDDVIDLTRYATELANYLKGSIARFAAKHPDAEVSCVALYFTTYGSSVFINYETRSHSDAWVKKYQKDRDHAVLIGKDAAGPFNKSPNDFEFGQHDEFRFKELPNFYEVQWPVKFRGLDGKVREVDSPDESVGRVLLESFEPALKSFDAFGKLKRADVFRMGISVHNTSCEAFWLHPAPVPDKSGRGK
jgi:hypothetical protein